MPRRLRVSFAPDVGGGRERWEAHLRFLFAVPGRVRHVTLEEVLLCCLNLSLVANMELW